MFVPAIILSLSAQKLLFAGGLLLCILIVQSSVRADISIADINSAEASNDETTRTINTCLAQEKVTLKKLIELEKQGHATWLEVAHRQLAIASLESQRKAATQNACFLDALRQRLTEPSTHDGDFSCDSNSPVTGLPILTLQIAAARVHARGEQQAAQLRLKKHRLHLAALDRLSAAGFATPHELLAARNDLADSQSYIDRLSLLHADDLCDYERLKQAQLGTHPNRDASRPERPPGNSPDREVGDDSYLIALRPGGPARGAQPGLGEHTRPKNELRPDDLPLTLLNKRGFLPTLLQLQNARLFTVARQELISLQLSLTTELLHRTKTAKRQAPEPDPELNRIQLDLEILQAEKLAADERLSLLRLEEHHFIAVSAIQPNDAAPQTVLRIDSPTSALPVFAKGLETRLSAGQQSPLTAAAWQPIAPNWPINNWSATRQIAAPSLPLSGNANVRFSEPNYADFYMNGNRRLDAPSTSNNFFRSGGLPWYLPGSSTNFK